MSSFFSRISSFASYNGTDWMELALDDATKTRDDLAGQVLIGFATHNDTGGAAPPFGGYGGNGHTVDPLDPLNPANAGGNVQNESNYSAQRIRVFPNGPVVGPPSSPTIALGADGKVTISWTGDGTLRSSGTLAGPWNPVANQTNPYVVTPTPGSQTYYRLSR